MADVVSDVSETVNTPEKKVANSPVKEKKVPDSPALKEESPAKEKAAESRSTKMEEEEEDVKEDGALEQKDVKENGASEEEEQNGDTKDEEETDSSQKGCKWISGASEPVNEKKVSDSPTKKVESPAKEKGAENGYAKIKEEDVKENGTSEEKEYDDEVVENEQNGVTKDERETNSCQKGCKRKSGASKAVVEPEENTEKKAKLEEVEEYPATAEPEIVEV